MKNRKWIPALGSLMIGAAVLAGCSGKDQSGLKVISQKTVELGDEVSLDPADYLLEESADINPEEITVKSDLMDDPKYDYNGFWQTVTTKGKDELEIGTYTITLSYKGKDYPVTLRVEDTVMPEFISPAAVVTIPVGTESFDFSRIYRTSDKDDVELTVEGSYDVNTVGTYPVTLIAKDASGNTNSLEITINVVGKNQPIQATDQFDDELVPPSDSQTETEEPVTNEQPDQNQTGTPDDSDNSQNSGGSTPPPTACAIPNAPAGTQVFYNFSDLYAAGTAWNQANPNNYFYYLEGSDDCGNKVYFLTTGSNEQSNPTAQQAQTGTPNDKH